MRQLASDLDRVQDSLATDLLSWKYVDGVSEALAGLGSVVAWMQDQSSSLKKSARIVEDLERRHLDWDQLVAGGDGALLDRAAAVENVDVSNALMQLGFLTRWSDNDARTQAQLVRAWFAQLSPAMQVALAQRASFEIGNLDGVPFGARDLANRHQLGVLEAGLRKGHPEIPEDLTLLSDDQFLALRAGLSDAAWPQLEAARAIRLTLKRPDRHLVSLDFGDKLPEAAIAHGDLDTATDVAVFTPGFTTTVGGAMQRIDKQMEFTQSDTTQVLRLKGGGDRSLAGVSWIGYQIPQMNTIVSFDDESVAGIGAAQNGAVKLSSFYDAIASRPDDVHLVAFGHSYGSTTTALGISKTRGIIDDAVFFGSPGLGTNNADKLGVPKGHVFVMEAEGDPVADLGSFGADPNRIPGVDVLGTSGGQTSLGLRGGSEGHSEYLPSQWSGRKPGEDPVAEYNLATVWAGYPDDATRARHDGAGIGDFIGDTAPVFYPPAIIPKLKSVYTELGDPG